MLYLISDYTVRVFIRVEDTKEEQVNENKRRRKLNMEWMQCNSCWLKVQNRQSQFHLTQCGHVYCDKCVVKAEERCCQCGTVNTISLPLKEPLNPQIAHYFSKPAELLEKVIQAAQFQESQRTLYLKQSETTQNKYQSLKEAYWASTENLKKVYLKYNKLKMTLALMQKEQKKASVTNSTYSSQYETPPNQMNNSMVKICQRNGKQDYFDKNNFNNSKRDDEVFRVPTITKVPRSAGYYTASSTSSCSSSHRITTPNSKFCNY